jgi:MoaA/NifB/PqqE/SkfB family radical SAM enzyme
VNSNARAQAHVDEQGRLVLEPEVAVRYGLTPGADIWLDDESDSLRLRRPVTQLAKLYLEPTNRCNLDCVTCVRNVWEETLGQMSTATFERILAGLQDFDPPPTVFFGGFGEPLAHPQLSEMIARVKHLGAQVELITNGTLLTEHAARLLIEAGLDVLWVSIDGATPESYADVRLGARLPQVIENVGRVRDLQARDGDHPQPEIGIAFVAMKRNIADLPAVLRLGSRLGASHFMITNVLPYAAELCDEVLYARALGDSAHLPSPWSPHVNVPKMDMNDLTREPLYQLLRSHRHVNFLGGELSHANDRCPFIEGGMLAVGWDGGVSPCLPLLHSHTSYLDRRERYARRYIIGNVLEHDLRDLWLEPEHVAFRERVRRFDFSPCTTCGGCDLAEANEEDCFGNPFPTCGGCLWAQGVIRCP